MDLNRYTELIGLKERLALDVRKFLLIAQLFLAPSPGVFRGHIWRKEHYDFRYIPFFNRHDINHANSSTIFEFDFAYGIVLGIAQPISFSSTLPAAVSWFKRGTGIGTGSMMVVKEQLARHSSIQALCNLFENFGWQNTFLIFGIFGTLIIFACLFFFSDSPEEKVLSRTEG